MHSANALHNLSLLEVRNLLALGRITPSQVVEACLKRIADTEPTIRAILTLCAEEAREQALRLEAAGPPDLALQPLWGVPVTVKDLLCTKGIRTTCASRFLEDFVPPYDAFVVDRLKKSGAILIGKTNLDEFAMGSSTEFSAFQITRNPWNAKNVPGGSSGGAAASVAAMQAYGALGSDTGGSIRQPAGLCGVVGLKPTYGRVSRYGAVAYASSFDQIGPLARTVDDCALLFSAIAGYDPKDATSALLPPPDLAGLEEKGDFSGLTFGLPLEYWSGGLSPEVEETCRKAVATAESLGARVREISLPRLPYGLAAYYILASAEASSNLARFDGLRYGRGARAAGGLIEAYADARTQGFGQEVKRRILLGAYTLSAGYYDAYYTKASQVRRLILEDFQAALAQCDALMAPVCPVTAWEIGALIDDPLTCYKMDILTVCLNLAGLPGLCLPVGLGAQSRLHVGLQIMGRAFDEARILRFGRILEDAIGFRSANAVPL
ncbi:MAG: Asp-tRNA(Asn)/Glu-tRNA(Gln) amidotransferase subunit GatA [Deltaproteobacteria bacterium]|jgi:aspartyl-tRNA(Asn)/glutamyl-tRNA(Gln) amidotransferase subunit A|nr:Asp-tRNA(Asn)/Glu-tRNA(Gln) amidotransferase subunit GatA [Deltaproteobacteria bacterium]